MIQCPCCSGLPYAGCCEPFLAGTRQPETAEQAMRARYTAHVRVDVPYLMATLHADNMDDEAEESARRWASQSEWQGLEIRATEAGGPEDDEGWVEFVARYRDRRGDIHAHHELSGFVRENGRWLFREARAPEKTQVRRGAGQVGRNDPCTCGSGKKFKKCCGARG